MPPPLRRPNLPSLTGARWWAALAVFLLHALVFIQAYPFQQSDLFKKIHALIPMQLGSAGVTFFFILSGFLIYWSNSEVRTARDMRKYYTRRVTKIVPTHWVSILLFLLASATITSAGITWVMDFSRLELWLPNALLIHTWNPDWVLLSGMNVPSWSLVAEMAFYLSFPLLIPLVRRIPNAWWGLIGAFAISLVLVTAIYLYAPGAKGTENFFVPRLWDMPTSPIAEVHAHPAWFKQEELPVDTAYWLSYYFPLTRLVDFYLGVFAARLVWEGRFTGTRIGAALALLAASYLATWFVPVPFKMSVVMALPMTLVVATLASRDMQGLSGWIGSPVMVWLGNVSFAFYMVQFPVMVAVQRYVLYGRALDVWGWAAAAAGVFVITLVLSWLVYSYVDEPLMKLARRAGKPRKVGLHRKKSLPIRGGVSLCCCQVGVM